MPLQSNYPHMDSCTDGEVFALMGKFKMIAILIIIMAVATPLGIIAIQHYQETKAIVSERQEKELQEKLAAIEAKEQKELAEKKAHLAEREAKTLKSGIKDDKPDEVLRGLTMQMEESRRDDGSTAYYYAKPTESGIFIQPYVIHNGGTNAQLRILVCRIGQNPVDFSGVDLLLSDDKKFSVTARSGVTEMPDGDGIIQFFDQEASKGDEEALRYMVMSGVGKIVLPGLSDDDRYLSAHECERVQDMLELYDILRGKKKT